MERLSIRASEDRCTVKAPYNSYFVEGARNLAGRFDKVWIFPASQERRVRELCLSTYGVDSDDEVIPTVTVRLHLQDQNRWVIGMSVDLCGRRIARVFGRDGGASLAENVVVLSGGFESAGSRKNPRIVIKEGTVIEVLEVPRPVAQRVVAEGATGCVVSAEIAGLPDSSDIKPAPLDQKPSLELLLKLYNYTVWTYEHGFALTSSEVSVDGYLELFVRSRWKLNHRVAHLTIHADKPGHSSLKIADASRGILEVKDRIDLEHKDALYHIAEFLRD